MEDPIYRDMLADVASLYYFQELTQNEIAEKLGLSRVKVYRLLKEARDTSVVEIIIHRPRPRDDALERTMKQRFGLADVMVLDTRGLDSVNIWQAMGEMSARYVERLLKDDSTLAVCLGRSTYEVVHAIRPGLRANVRIAQALGSIPFATQELDSSTLVRELALKLGGEVFYLPSPMMADSPEAAVVLRRQRDIERTLAAAREADLALLGISNLDPVRSRLMVAAGLSPAQVADLRASGAVGDMAGQIFTLDGELHANELTGRIIGLTLDELKRIPTVIAVAFGASKAKAILGALRTGAIDVLCTDDKTAGEIMQMGKPAAQEGGA